MSVKSKIQQIRKDTGLTQADMASKIGISRQAYRAIELGKSVPTTETALRLARSLKTTVGDLFWLDDNSPEEILDRSIIPVSFNSKIHHIRKNAGFTQTDMAKAIGISRQAYIAIELGKSVPTTETSLRLARSLKTTVEDLF